MVEPGGNKSTRRHWPAVVLASSLSLLVALVLVLPFFWEMNFEVFGHGIKCFAIVGRRAPGDPLLRMLHDLGYNNSPGVQVYVGDVSYCLWWH